MNKYKTIILISVDDLRFDCISCEKDKRWLKRYNTHSVVDTPALDSIAQKGIRFTQCISTSSYTPSSHTSMVTGLYTNRHGVKTFFHPLSNGITTLQDILKKKGWKTSAWTEHLTLNMQKITKGIDTVIEPFLDEKANLFEFINRLPPEKNNFVFIHLFDVHKPYFYTTGGSERSEYNKNYLEEMRRFSEDLSINFESLLLNAQTEAQKVVTNYNNLSPSLQEYAVFRSLDYLIRKQLRTKDILFEEIVPLYVRGVNKFDHGKFKDLIDTIEKNGLLEDSLLIIVSDHGETRCTWNEREDFMNSFNVSEGAIRVPLIMHSENLPEDLEVNTEVSIIDIVPTILDILDIKCDLTFDGISLKPMIENENRRQMNRTLYSDSWAYEGRSTFFGNTDSSLKEFLAEACARRGGFKYVWRNEKIGTDDFYNSTEDPFEENSLPYDETARALKKKLSNYLLRYSIRK
jgi:arylsulfatase A-like enzyme